MEFPTILDPVLRHLITVTRDYVSEVRHIPVEFHISIDDMGFVTAKFDYGRASTGQLIQAVCGAIGNALEPISHQSMKELKG